MRDSDRWVTPRVVVVGLVVAGGLVVFIAACVTYLVTIGRDPDAMLRLTAEVATGIGSIGSLALQLAGRRTVAKVERNVGALAYRQCECGEEGASDTRPLGMGRPRRRGE